MIEILYSTVYFFKRKTKILWKFIYKINKFLANILCPIYYIFSNKIMVDNSSNIIVSLTTYPERINTVWLTIETLFHQKNVKAKNIVLWLASEQFPDKKIPIKLLEMQKRGLIIKYCDDLKSHKKYYYSFKEFSNYIVVTVDDDMLYPENFLEQLYLGHLKYKNTIICNWNCTISFDKKGNLDLYDNWGKISNELSLLCVPIGCGGVLYDPKLFPQELYDKNKIKRICENTDDLWLKWMELKQNINAINVNQAQIIYFNNMKNQKNGLYKKNTGSSKGNDMSVKLLEEEYPNIIKKLKIM